jgi:DNA-binding CsgD family transcriptional regulator
MRVGLPARPAPSTSPDWRDHAACRDTDASSRAHGRGKHSARSGGPRTSGEIGDVFARARLAQGDWPTTAALVPLLDVPVAYRVWVAAAFLLGTIARDTLADPDAAGRALPHHTGDARRLEPLTHGETRVLRYLPTNLSAREIADDLYLSVNTVKTHQRHLYQKLGARSRTQAVEQARVLGLLAPSARRG